jgi:DNA invertase Pin-like site-specific DNA recombinase
VSIQPTHLSDASGKVTAARLARDAYLYIRQSTLYQVANNTESTTRQYDLAGRAVALGWPSDRIHVIDIDQGHSGASAADREGFQHLVAQVSLGHAGIVLGLECSRLARNNADWHRLLQICAHNDTLICDEDGLYDPTSFNDRLLLGMKGQMSEAELHFLRARLRGGILAKARRGDLKLALPIGLTYDGARNVVLDPDAGVRTAITLALDTFAATGSAFAVVRSFREQALTFPARHHSGPHRGQLYWKPLTHTQILNLLHNPRYAGAYCYGRSRHTSDLEGRHHTTGKPIDEWTVLIQNAHPGYLSWAQYETNLATLAANAAAHGPDRAAGPAREGPALLQGLAVCGRCGRRMTMRYHTLADATTVPEYVCQSQGINTATPICQSISGATVDAAVAEFVLATLTPLALEVALSVSDELVQQAEQSDAIRAAHVQRAQHTADAARRRYLAVDPTNRLVADTLEADWNATLRQLATAQDDYTKARNDPAGLLTDAQRQRVRDLAADFPALWKDPATPTRERKRLLRLLVTDVTLLRNNTSVTAHLRLPGGQDHTLTVDLPPKHWHRNPTPKTTLVVLDELLNTATFAQAAAALNHRCLTDGAGRPFTSEQVRYHCGFYKIPTRAQRLHTRGLLTLTDIATQLGVHPYTVKRWRELGLLRAEQSSDAPSYMFHPGQTRPTTTAVWTAEIADRRGAPSRYAQLRTAGLLTLEESATEHGVTPATISHWRELALLTGEQTDLKNRWLYHPNQPTPTRPQVLTAVQARRSDRPTHQTTPRPPTPHTPAAPPPTKNVRGHRHDEAIHPDQPPTHTRTRRTREEGAV